MIDLSRKSLSEIFKVYAKIQARNIQGHFSLYDVLEILEALRGHYVRIEIFRPYSRYDPLFDPAGHYQYIRIHFWDKSRTQEISFRTLPYWQVNQMLGLGKEEYQKIKRYDLSPYEQPDSDLIHEQVPVWTGYRVVKEFIPPIHKMLTPISDDPFDGRLPAPTSEPLTNEQKELLREALKTSPYCYDCPFYYNCSPAPFIDPHGPICDTMSAIIGEDVNGGPDDNDTEAFIDSLRKIADANIKYVLGLQDEEGLIKRWVYLSDFIRALIEGKDMWKLLEGSK